MVTFRIVLFACLCLGTFSSTASAEPTALHKHVAFFDRDGDGLITVSETYQGLKALGFADWKSWALAYAINGALGPVTGGGLTTVDVENIHKGKHPGDTDIYNDAGEFDAEKFEALFAEYDLDGDDALDDQEFRNFRVRNNESLAGTLASVAEFGLLMDIAGEPRPYEEWSWWSWSYVTRWKQVLTRDTLAAFYDGSLFFTLAGEPVPE